MQMLADDTPIQKNPLRKLPILVLLSASFGACTGPAADAPPIAIAAADTAMPMPTPSEDPNEEAVRAYTAQALGADPSRIAVRRISSRAGLSAWRASADGKTATAGRQVLAVIVDGPDVLRGRVGFVNWVRRHGRHDPVATSIAYHVLVQGGTSEPYGSWTAGIRRTSDPRYDLRGHLVFFHGDSPTGEVVRTTLTFGPDDTVIDAVSDTVPSHPPPSG